MIDKILWMLGCHENEGEYVKEDIELFIESKKFNIKNTVRDTNIIIRMMYEISKAYRILSHHQSNYYPELEL